MVGAAVGTAAATVAATTAVVGSATAATGAAAAAVTGAAAVATAGGIASYGLLAAAILAGPVGLAVVGHGGDNALTFDCWKQIVRDTSPEPSRGRLLRDLVASPMVAQAMMLPDGQKEPQLVINNIWGESFRLDFLYLFTGGENILAAHAVRVH